MGTSDDIITVITDKKRIYAAELFITALKEYSAFITRYCEETDAEYLGSACRLSQKQANEHIQNASNNTYATSVKGWRS